MRQDRKSFIHIKEVIDNIFTTSTLPVNLDDTRIWKVWDGVVGKKIAQHARPSSIKRGVLVVKVTDSVWLHELEFMTEAIKEKLNSKLQRDAIKKIRLKVGEPLAREGIESKRSKKESGGDPSPDKQGEMERILARIKDRELRSSLRKIMKVAAGKDSENSSD